MGEKSLDREKNDTWEKPVLNRFLKSIIDESKRISDWVVNWRSIQTFENILYAIISENRLVHFVDEPYYDKLSTLQNFRRDNNDISRIELKVNKIWLVYSASWYEISFTRNELESIWNRFTHLTVY